MARTLEQKIARLRHQNRKLETGQKIILGVMLINAAKQSKSVGTWLLKEVQRAAARKVDKEHISILLEEIKNFKDGPD